MVVLEIGFLLLLIVVNGFFAMSELAVVSARKARLAALEAEGLRGARAARELAEDPGRFLSSVQIGITLVGVLAGAFGSATLGPRLAPPLAAAGLPGDVADTLAVVVVVLVVTYLSLIVGELVPKQIALGDPERRAAGVARFMRGLARVGSPAVWALDRSSHLVLRVFGLHERPDRGVSEEEIRAIIAEGETAGVVEPEETKMIGRVMRLGDLSVRSAMTPRPDVDWIDLDEPPAAQLAGFLASPHSRLPVGRGRVDEVEAAVRAKDVARALAAGEAIDLAAMAQRPAILHDGSDVLDALEALRRAEMDMAFVVDEYGTFEGLVTSADVLAAIAGELRGTRDDEEPDAIARDDGSWLLDGGKPIEEAADLLGFALPKERDYHTLAGFALESLRRVPRSGDGFAWGGWRFEVVDMDGRRIDKILARIEAAGGEAAAPDA